MEPIWAFGPDIGLDPWVSLYRVFEVIIDGASPVLVKVLSLLILAFFFLRS